MTDLKKRLAELKKRCAAHNRQIDAVSVVEEGGAPIKSKAKVRPGPKPRLVVDNSAIVAPAPEPIAEISPDISGTVPTSFASVLDYPLPDFVFERLDHHKYQLPRQLKSKGRYVGGGHLGTSVGFV